MTETKITGSASSIALTDRAVIALEGPDGREFLQAIVTNDVDVVSESRALYSALLTPQGKFLHDFFVFQIGDTLYLDVDAARRDDLMRRLSVYKLRADLTIEDRSGGFAVYALLGEAAAALGLGPREGDAASFAGGIAFIDPRLAALGARAIAPPAPAAEALEQAGFTAAGRETYHALRIGLGVPDGGRDMEPDKSMPLEYGLGDLNGVDFDKGCFIGQEVTARMKRRGLVRKRLLPVDIDGAPPAPGATVTRGDHDAGEMRAAMDSAGLALLRLDRIAADGPGLAADLTADGARITPRKPDWAEF